jgi:PHD/YefM family antitoxin component YafN of YafNO toxin-antitoxin module
MIELHPEILKQNGKDEFVVLPYEEFAALRELLNDYEDLLDLRAAKKEEQEEPSIPLSELKREFDED